MRNAVRRPCSRNVSREIPSAPGKRRSPMAKAPFRTPVRNATPLLQPVRLLKSAQTNELVAYSLGIDATTMTVTRPPTTIRKSPTCWRYGMVLLQKITNAVTSHIMQTNATYECHASITRSGWNNAYLFSILVWMLGSTVRTTHICTMTFAGIVAMETRAKIQPKKFRLCKGVSSQSR